MYMCIYMYMSVYICIYLCIYAECVWKIPFLCVVFFLVLSLYEISSVILQRWSKAKTTESKLEGILLMSSWPPQPSCVEAFFPRWLTHQTKGRSRTINSTMAPLHILGTPLRYELLRLNKNEVERSWWACMGNWN